MRRRAVTWLVPTLSAPNNPKSKGDYMSATEYVGGTKSGKGLVDNVSSELAAFFDVTPGHEEQLVEALERFEKTIRETPPAETIKTGLRSTRHVLFNEGRTLLWATTFETDWDPYLDDALLVVGPDKFIDWMQHTAQGGVIIDWYERNGGAAGFDKSRDDYDEVALKASPELRKIIQSRQVAAVSYFESLSPWTMPQVIQAAALREAFDKVLEHPDAEQALTHPALAPVLELASV
jgi:hypothetical protein